MEGKRPEIRFKGYDDEWVSKRFGDAFDFISNNTLSRDNLNNESGAALNVHYGDVLIKFGEYLDVQKEQLPFISDEALVSKFQTSLLRDGDVIIADTAEDTTVGKCTEIVCVDGKKIISGLHTMACRPKEKYTLRFLGYCLNSPKYHKNLLPLMQGVKVLSISKSGISDTNIVISENRDEQGKIANFLAALDRKIKAELLKCEKLAILKKTMLKKIFPAGERKVPEIRFDGYTDDWEQRKVTEFGEVYIGLVTTMTAHYTNEGTLLIRNSDIKDGKFEFDTEPIYLDKEFAEQNKSRMHKVGDVITVHTGDVGTSAVITENEANSIGFATIVTRPNQKLLDSYYLSTFLNTENHKAWAVQMSTGDGRTNYNLRDYTELVVPVPKLEEQKKIASYISSLNNLITLHQCKLERLKNIKSACIKKMFV